MDRQGIGEPSNTTCLNVDPSACTNFIALAARFTVMPSSRQMGVRNFPCNSAWSIKSSYPVVVRSFLNLVGQGSETSDIIGEPAVTVDMHYQIWKCVADTLDHLNATASIEFQLHPRKPDQLLPDPVNNASVLGRTGISAPTETL